MLSSDLLHGLFERWVPSLREQVAVVDDESSITFGELERRSNQLAHRLVRAGVGPDRCVVLMLERSAEMVVAILGTLKAGGAYVPLEPNLPRTRAEAIISDCRASCVVAAASLFASHGAPPAPVIELDHPGLASELPTPPPKGAHPANLAYVIFTSGSTGRPKGVAVEHRQIVHYVEAINERMRFPERTQFAMASTFSADVGHTALFGALCLGGTLHVLSRRRALSPSGLAEYFAQHPVDFLKIAPSHFRALWAGGSGILPRRGVLFGGEALPWTLVDSVLNERPNLALHNYYGPSETTASITTHHTNRTAPRVSASVPIGLGLADVRLYVLDGRLEPTQVGEPGELYVGGLAVSRGYLGRADLTAERYLPDPFAAQDGLRMYQTGDRVRQLVGGELEFLGRADSQVKIRGFRVELGEVEAALAAQPQVREARVVVRRDASDREQLVGYVVGVGVALLDGDALRRSLGQQLPDYMVPIAVVPIATMPLTSNGKLDQSALPLPEALEPK